MRIRRAAWLLAPCALLLVSAAQTPDPSVPDYGARPAHFGNPDLPAGSYLHAVEPGITIVDAVEVFNFTAEPAAILVYTSDLVRSTGGTLAPPGPDVEVTGAGTWLTPEHDEVMVAPRSSELVAFDLTAPAGTPPGDYAAALIVEPRAVQGPGNIVNRARIAMRVDIEVLGEVDLGVAVGDVTWTRTDGGIRFTTPVTNTGTVTFAAGGYTQVEGWRIEPTQLALGPSDLYPGPGNTVTVSADWDNPPLFGHFRASTVVDATVGPRVPVRFVSAEIDFWIVPWGLVVGALAGFVLIAVGVFATRRPRRRLRERRRAEREVVRRFREEQARGSARSGALT